MSSVEGVTIHRAGSSLEVKCMDESDSWTLQCVKHEWLGTRGECAKPGNSQTQQETDTSEKRINISHEFFIIAGGILALFISGVIVCVGLIQLCKRKPSSKGAPSNYATYSYNPARQQLRMRTLTHRAQQPHQPHQPQIPDFDAMPSHNAPRSGMPDVIDSTLERAAQAPDYPAPVTPEEAIYENPGPFLQDTLSSDRHVYQQHGVDSNHVNDRSRALSRDELVRGGHVTYGTQLRADHAQSCDDAAEESDYTDSLKYYVLDQQ